MDEFPFLNDQDFKTFFLLSKTVVRNTKLQVFQYKIMHRILPVKDNLLKWGLSETNQCFRCGNRETIEHLLFDCPCTQTFLKMLERWLTYTFQRQINLPITTVLFGIPIFDDDTYRYINFIIIHTKWYLYTSNLDCQDLFLFTFLSILKHHIYIESYAEKINPKSSFNNKWSDLLNIL